ncbi:MAG: Ribose import permease protein RbsC [Nitrospira sp.]|nr:Ribose import permease protein RbsC [Nitrospira sp.]
MSTKTIKYGHHSPARDWVRFTPVFGLLLILVIALVVAPSFFQPTNLSNLSRQVGILAVVAAGQTLVLLVRGIDLSVGAVMTLSMVIVARISEGDDQQLLGAVGTALLLGLIVGVVNAILIVGRRVPPFVATLATAVLIVGFQTAWTQGVPGGEISPVLADIGSLRILGIPTITYIALLLVGIVAVFLKFTIWGRWIYTTGGNPEAARVGGVPVAWVTAGAYVACSLLAVFGGLLLGGYAGYVDGYLGGGYELDSIAAAVIGGTSFAGGVGGVGRSLLGSVVIASVLNMIVLTGADEWLQLVVKGSIILVAVGVQTTRWQSRMRGGSPA